MTLPKGARKIRVGGKTYRWMIGKPRKSGREADLVVMSPEGVVWTEAVGLREPGYEGAPIPWTPAHTKDFIEEKLRSTA